jgi:hypothetical protein
VSPFNNITITGSGSAPSGQSRAGIEYLVGAHDTWNNVSVSGSFSKGALVEDSPTHSITFYASHFANSYPGAPTLAVDFRNSGAVPAPICPTNMSCTYTYMYRSSPFTLSCQSGTIQVSKSTFHNLSQSADCTPYVATQCNGKSSCTLLFTGKADSCNAITIGDGPNSDYSNADTAFSCAGTSVNVAPAGVDTTTIFTDSPLPNYVADVDNVTASHFVNAPQPTVATNSNFIDVTQHGILPWGPTEQTAAIQALIDSAADGTTFYFPKGWYMVSTLDFSRLKHFTIQGDGKEGNAATVIVGRDTALRNTIAIKADYGSGAGTFAIRDLDAIGTPSIYARNSALSTIENVEASILLDNPFMVSMRSIHTGGEGDAITVNGGMHSTVEVQDNGGGNTAYREWGVDHAIYASRNEGRWHLSALTSVLIRTTCRIHRLGSHLRHSSKKQIRSGYA